MFDNRITLLLVSCGVLIFSKLAAGQDSPVDPAGTHVYEAAVVDADSSEPLPVRVHIRGEDGEWYHCESIGGEAVEYRREPEHLPHSFEVHTTLSPHPFRFRGSAGRYEIRIERGKEYIPLVRTIELGAEKLQPRVFRLQRWIDMSAAGWYSGDTHVHRKMDELPNAMLAEDLNVVFPLNYWVTHSGVLPAAADRSVGGPAPPKLIKVDPTHVIWPRNTEYELFFTNGKQHTQGAVFVLNHRSVLDLAAPPVGPIASRARQESALLDLDKHSWPWSLMIVPLMDVDFFELSNNHLWQTRFGFSEWTLDKAPEYMKLKLSPNGFTEESWTDFGFQTYYGLLNCGFPLRVSAGTASGVHPVQIGFGRVYVYLKEGFEYDAWIDGLNAGRSFVTTGPMLQVTFNESLAGRVFTGFEASEFSVRIQGRADSRRPLSRIEVVASGEVVASIDPQNRKTLVGAFESIIDETIVLKSTGWVAVRCFEDHPERRVRFAHTNPVFVKFSGSRLRPRRAEVQYFIDRIREELARNRELLDEASIAEYQKALDVYLEIAKRAR